MYSNNDEKISIEEATVESIAKLLFSDRPKNIGQYQLFPSESDPELLFEILLTLFMEGIMILNNNLEEIDFNSIDSSILHKKMCDLEEWFRTISYDLFIDKIDRDNRDNNHYCKILLKSTDSSYFVMKNIDKSYTFIINGDTDTSLSRLEDYKALFISNNTAYRIWFSKIS